MDLSAFARNSKAYYRRALARKAMGYLFDAERDLQAVLALEPKSTAFHVELRDIQELIAHTAETSNSSRMTALPSIPKVEDSKEAKADRNANEVKLKQRFDRTVKEKFADIASRPSKKDAVSRQRSNSSTDNLCDMHQFEACLKYGLPEPTCPCGEDHDWEDEDTDGSYYDYDDNEGSEDYSDIEQAAAAAVEEAKRRINGVPNTKGMTDNAANKLLRDSIMPSGTSVNISDEVNTRMQAALKNPGLDSFDQLKQ
ncbi:hypothetical protein QFC22_004042 [Naganishia vaughanmartiniae]|uniref:Uncharacterized protein n=1 Tax=Naganishia vaughanmartiniae TaxID=1424756 RepID=A0ACC2X474_9TREE|nr:hypothetical protein QFC22_004042 [Naganishia vaughanmartiniae]